MPTALETVDLIVKTLPKYRIRYSTEAELERNLIGILEREQIQYSQQHTLDRKNRVDIYINRVAVELKVAGSAQAIVRQLTRYASFDCVDALLLITGTHLAIPPFIEGKPARIFYVGGTWL